ncbi:hypothetical protein B0A55_10429 [Friedmanniomyces simplex]|uniref:SnoaL-like domain-containing protein n=1 Tax=Friedmanniomyces simplex TaxID=329884 RepID=A0A4U0WJ05_9PEZI|nr:hypothetical protein B0A55_10429 [Friedmanniomyces simplex]
MSAKATDLVSKLLANSTNLDIVKELVAEDATYVSLNYNNPELTGIEPWCGTHNQAGPAAIHQTFVDSEHVAIFGRFVYCSKSIGKLTDSPFAVWGKVDMARGKVTYMQSIEDTPSTANSFRKSGRVVYQSHPESGEECAVDV